MSQESATERWARVVSSLESRLEATRKMLEAVRTIGDLIESHPELADDLLAPFQSHQRHAVEGSESDEVVGDTEPVETPIFSAARGSSLYDRVCALLMSRNNDPMSSPEIARALGTVRGAVSHVLYNEPWKLSFQHIKKPGNVRNVYWKLTEEEFLRRQEGDEQTQPRGEQLAGQLNGQLAG